MSALALVLNPAIVCEIPLALLGVLLWNGLHAYSKSSLDVLRHVKS
jgi:hypothetical protein